MAEGQKQLMLLGQLYTADDTQLRAEHLHAQAVLEEFNSTKAVDGERGRELLSELLGYFGKGATIKPSLRCDYGYNIHVGDRSFINYDAVLLDCNTITIGNDVQIAPGVHIYTATHPLDPVVRKTGLELAYPVTICDGVWIGGGAIVCPGVTIGKNTVVGAGTVVVKDLPANVLAAGNPARIIRPIGDPV